MQNSPCLPLHIQTEWVACAQSSITSSRETKGMGTKALIRWRSPSQSAHGLKWHDQEFYSKQHLGETEFSLVIVQLHQCLSLLPHWHYLSSGLPLTQTHHTDPTNTQQKWEKDGRTKLRAPSWLSRALFQSSPEGHIFNSLCLHCYLDLCFALLAMVIGNKPFKAGTANSTPESWDLDHLQFFSHIVPGWEWGGRANRTRWFIVCPRETKTVGSIL